jgi:hypothetical protein
LGGGYHTPGFDARKVGELWMKGLDEMLDNPLLIQYIDDQ